MSVLTDSALFHGRTILDVALLVVAAVLLPLQSVVTGWRLRSKPKEEIKLARYYVFGMLRAAAIATLLLYDWSAAERPWAALGLDWPIGTRGLIGFGFVALLILLYAVQLSSSAFEQRAEQIRKALDRTRVLPRTARDFAIFPLLAVVGSTMEELLFRGFLIWLFAPWCGLAGAVAVSALLFGLGHIYQGLFGVVRTGLIGLGLGAGYALTHSLWWLIAAHIAVNLFGGLYAWRLKRLPAPSA